MGISRRTDHGRSQSKNALHPTAVGNEKSYFKVNFYLYFIYLYNLIVFRQEKYTFLLTVAVAAPNEIIEVAYDVSYMNE